MKTFHFLIVIYLLFFSIPLISQITSGTITMSIVDIKTSEVDTTDEIKGISEMLKNTDMTIYFNPKEKMTELNTLGTTDIKIFYKNNRMIQYIDMMGQKIKMITSPLPDSQSTSEGSDEEDKETYEIRYDRNDTRKILGYPCYKASIITKVDLTSTETDLTDPTTDIELIWYITEGIEMNDFGVYRMPGLKVNGTPLRMDINIGMLTLTYEATSVSEIVDDSKFEEPKGDYKEISSEKLEKMGLPTNGKY